MLKLKVFVLFLLLSVAVLTVNAGGLLKNGGFESLKPDGSFPTDWGIHYIWSGPCQAVNDLANAHSGSVAVRVNQKGPKAHKDFVAIGSSRVPAKAGAKYRLSLWAKGKGAVSMTIYFSSHGKYLSSDGTFPPKTPLQNNFATVKSAEWKQYVFDFKVPEKQTAITPDHDKLAPETIEVLINVKGELFLDDVELYPSNQLPKGSGNFKMEDKHRTLLTIPYLAQAPVIDGKLNEAAWKKAAVTTGFCAAGGGVLSPQQTIVYAGYDSGNLYLAFTALKISCADPGASGELTGAPSNVEEFEIWLAPDGQKWYQLLVTPGDGFLSRQSDGAGGWGRKAKYKTTCVESTMMFGGILATDSKTWYGEIAIPFAAIGMQTPVDDSELRINFCRDYATRSASTERASTDWTTWSRVTGFGDVKNYGIFRFARNTPAVQWSGIGDLVKGNLCVTGAADRKLNVQARVRLPKLNNKVMLSAEGTADKNGKFELKSEISGGGAEKTEAVLDVAISEPSGRVLCQNVIPFVLMPPFGVGTQLLYSSKKVVVKADFPRLAHSGKCAITFAVKNAAQTAVASKKLPVAVKDCSAAYTFDIGGWKPGTYELAVRFDNVEGKTVIANSVALVIPEKPTWMNGVLWQDRSVPEPYTPMKQKGCDTSVVLRTYSWLDSGLPKQVTYKEHKLFAAPSEVLLTVNGKTEKFRFEPLKLKEAAADVVMYQISGKSESVELTGMLTVEFDGFARWNVILNPRKAQVKVTGLTLNFPINSKDALFLRGDGCTGSLLQDQYTKSPRPSKRVHLGNAVTSFGSWMYDANGWSWPEQFFNEIVIGSDRYAFSVMSEDNEFVRGKKYLSAEKKASSTVLKISLVSTPTVLTAAKPLKYDYFFQTMPIRPEPKDPKRWHAALDPSSIFCIDMPGYLNTPEGQKLLDNLYVGESYYDQAPQGFPTWAKDPKASEAALAKFHKHGMKIACNQWYAVIPEICAEYKQFGSEWRAYPEFYWGTPTSMMRSVCVNSAFADFHLANLERVFAETGMDGVYTDATPIFCNNAVHGCGWTDDKGERHADLNLLATRRFVKQMYRRLKANGRGKINYNHNGESPATAGFVDIRTDGEELIWEGREHYKRITPDYFRSTYAQNEYGVPYTFHAVFHYSWRRAGEVVPIREIMMMTLPHRVYHTLAYDVEMLPVWKIVDPWWTTSDFRPYWYSECPVTTSAPTDMLSSVFLKQKEKKALVIFSNWAYEPKTVQWKIAQDKLGFKVKSIVEYDTVTGKTRLLDTNNLKMSLKSRDFTIVELRGK